MARNLNPTELKRLHRTWRRRTAQPLALIVEAVASPFNIGAICRTAAAEGVDTIWFCAGATTPANTKVGKTALGAERYLAWHETATTAEAVAAARAGGFRVVGVELAESARPLHETDLTGPVALAIGHEDRGLSAGAFELCDAVGFIPQVGKIGSLNVATATAIAIYETRRQHWTA